MRAILAIVLLAAVVWVGYWFIGARAAETGFASWFEERRAEGWQAEYGEIAVGGFPNRFDANFTDISLADPSTGLAWEAPVFKILALSYQPNHVIAVWPVEQQVATPEEKFTLRSEDMRASMVLEANTGLTLDRATLTASGLSVAPVAGGAPLGANAVTLAAERVPADADAHYHMGLRADGLTPAAGWLERVDQTGSLPETLETLTADFTVVFDRPWDRKAIEVARPQPREITLKLAQARWGQLSLQAAGSVIIDARGMPEGSLTIKAENWREMLALGRASGALPENLARPMENALGLMAGLSGNPSSLDIPLDFRSGRIWLGPVPIGPAPVLRLR
ncbi:MAG: DUF2125 domain-containing protein [Roseovarius sp.]